MHRNNNRFCHKYYAQNLCFILLSSLNPYKLDKLDLHILVNISFIALIEETNDFNISLYLSQYNILYISTKYVLDIFNFLRVNTKRKRYQTINCNEYIIAI